MTTTTMKFLVRAADRSSAGYNGSWRGGRFWPSATDTHVEVLDQDECPMIPNEARPGEKMLDPNRVGRVAWASISTDRRLSIAPVSIGAVAVPVVQEVSTELADLREQNARLAAQVEGLTRMLEEAKAPKVSRSRRQTTSAPESDASEKT